MKHKATITILLVCMFIIAQLIGLAVNSFYSPKITQVTEGNSTTNQTAYGLPYGLEPPTNTEPTFNLLSIFISIIIVVSIILFLMNVDSKWMIYIFRIWFFVVVTIALGITITAAFRQFSFIPVSSAAIYAVIISLILSAIKVFHRDMIVHNFTELLIYPGISAIFVPLLNIWTVVLLLFVISFYDIYAVWQAGFMQKMAQFQIKKVRVFSGFFVPYVAKADLAKLKKSKSKKGKMVKMNVAILGGGDVVFPIILSGVVLHTFGLLASLIVTLGATVALGVLLYQSEKGRFYPAMPFISAGCFIALGIIYLIR